MCVCAYLVEAGLRTCGGPFGACVRARNKQSAVKRRGAAAIFSSQIGLWINDVFAELKSLPRHHTDLCVVMMSEEL